MAMILSGQNRKNRHATRLSGVRGDEVASVLCQVVAKNTFGTG